MIVRNAAAECQHVLTGNRTLGLMRQMHAHCTSVSLSHTCPSDACTLHNCISFTFVSSSCVYANFTSHAVLLSILTGNTPELSGFADLARRGRDEALDHASCQSLWQPLWEQTKLLAPRYVAS